MTITNRIRPVMTALLAALAMAAITPANADISYRYLDLSKQDLPEKGAKIDVIESPLSGAPQIRPDGTRLRIEVDDYRVLEQPVQVWLVPSFGEARERIDLTVESISRNKASQLWPGRTVHVIQARLPSLGGDVVEDLYDLHIKWSRYWGFKTIQDVQHRAVKIVDRIPDNPRIATIADPQIGDPRAIVDAARDSLSNGNLDPLNYTWSEVIGDTSPGDRWAAFQKTIEEINAQNPDFVLISGDLTFGAAYKYEFEDAYRLLNQIQAPTYIALGNHDGYDNPFRADGLAKWEKFFGPQYYSVNVGPNINLVGINSYDWPRTHRLVTTWGGSVRDGQLSWLANELHSWRDNNPEGLLMTFAHHDPSWEQSPGLLDNILDPQDQQWSGVNRLPLRKLLNDAQVDVHFAGHTHTNRVARYIDDGSPHGKLVETLHGNCFRHTTPREGDQNDIYHIDHCGQAQPANQQNLKSELLDHRNGPLFIETTTVSSEGAYWGWRVFDLTRSSGYWTTAGFQRGGVDSSVMGYPMTNDALHAIDEAQAIPGPGGSVNPDVADVGYYSHPSYFIEVEQTADSATHSEYRITNNSLVSFSGTVVQSLESCDSTSVLGGVKVWERTDKANARTDVRASYYVGAGDSATVTVSAASGASSCEENDWWSFW